MANGTIQNRWYSSWPCVRPSLLIEVCFMIKQCTGSQRTFGSQSFFSNNNVNNWNRTPKSTSSTINGGLIGNTRPLKGWRRPSKFGIQMMGVFSAPTPLSQRIEVRPELSFMMKEWSTLLVPSLPRPWISWLVVTVVSATDFGWIQRNAVI